MATNISAIAWVSKDRDALLARSMTGFKMVMGTGGRPLDLVVSGTNTTPYASGARIIDKVALCSHIIASDAADGIPEDVVRFALFGDPRVAALAERDTGSNRNAVLLSLVNRVFLTVDDDVLAQFAPMGAPDTHIVSDPLLRERITAVFLDRTACEAAVVYSEKNTLTEFLSTHERLLDYVTPDAPAGRVVATVSGIHGDSGAMSPRDLLLLNFPNEAAYAAAIRNKLLLRYVTRPKVTNRPFFMTMCAGLDNRALLPPFFPQGRNQDGVFASALMACLPNAHIGYVPWVVHHDPVPAREYAEGEVRRWRFRISELITLLLENFSKTHPITDSRAAYERYDEVGEFLENFSAQAPEALLASLRALCTPNLNLYADFLRDAAINKKMTNPLQASDMIGCADTIHAAQNLDSYCIPEELLELPLAEALQISRDLVSQYGSLLRHWIVIREAAALISDIA